MRLATEEADRRVQVQVDAERRATIEKQRQMVREAREQGDRGKVYLRGASHAFVKMTTRTHIRTHTHRTHVQTLKKTLDLCGQAARMVEVERVYDSPLRVNRAAIEQYHNAKLKQQHAVRICGRNDAGCAVVITGP